MAGRWGAAGGGGQDARWRRPGAVAAASAPLGGYLGQPASIQRSIFAMSSAAMSAPLPFDGI